MYRYSNRMIHVFVCFCVCKCMGMMMSFYMHCNYVLHHTEMSTVLQQPLPWSPLIMICNKMNVTMIIT